MYQQDWVMRQIKAIADAIAVIMFGKAEIAYEIQDEANHSETDMLFLRINEMLHDGNINEAENLLFSELDTGNMNYLLLAIDFYQKLNDKSDAELESSDFTREEIEEGLNNILKLFEIKL